MNKSLLLIALSILIVFCGGILIKDSNLIGSVFLENNDEGEFRETTFRFIERKPEVISLVGGEESIVNEERIIVGEESASAINALNSLDEETNNG